MTVHRADCLDCSWSFEGEDLETVSDKMERHTRKEVGHDVDLERAVATDGGSDISDNPLSLLFVRTTELVIARGEVSEDGSGIDGVWTAEFPDIDTEQNWFVAICADEEPTEYRVSAERTYDIKPYTAHYWYDTDAIVPGAIVTPYGGESLHHGYRFDRDTEDQLIASLETALDELDYDYSSEEGGEQA